MAMDVSSLKTYLLALLFLVFGVVAFTEIVRGFVQAFYHFVK